MIFQVVFRDGSTAVSVYSTFSIGPEQPTQYKLSVSGYAGTPGRDALIADAGLAQWRAVNMKFSTRDKDNDASPIQCSDKYGWWFNWCTTSSLNNDDYAGWVDTGFVKRSLMKIRRV